MTGRLTLCPRGLGGPDLLGAGGMALAGGPLSFTACEAVLRAPGRTPVRTVMPARKVVAWAGRFGPETADEAEGLLKRLCAPRPAFAGLDLDRPRVMGVINVTPDSFSDGGDRFDPGRAVADGLAMREAGAAILDVGGESTRPGAAPVDEDEELRRTIPVVRALAESGALVSIDTRHARVMAQALEAGARIVNDVTALAGDPASLARVAQSKAAVALMHMQGEPRSMQRNPHYDDAPLDVYDFLAARVAACEQAGIARARIAVDAGIGFGKTVAHNLRVIDRLAVYHGLGCALLLGVSRKSFVGRLSREEPAKERLPGSLAAALAGIARGVQILRVHDVAETVQALAVWQAIDGAAAPDDGSPAARSV